MNTTLQTAPSIHHWIEIPMEFSSNLPFFTTGDCDGISNEEKLQRLSCEKRGSPTKYRKRIIWFHIWRRTMKKKHPYSNLYVYMYVYIYIYVCVRVFFHRYNHVLTFLFIHLFICNFTFMCVCVSVCVCAGKMLFFETAEQSIGNSWGWANKEREPKEKWGTYKNASTSTSENWGSSLRTSSCYTKMMIANHGHLA